MEKKEIIWQGSTIFYRTMGKGKTVVLLHGFGEDGNVFQYQAAALKNDFHLIIPDIPGIGKSALVANASIETYAEIIKEILDKECPKFPGGLLRNNKEGEGASFIGHSMGGYVALAFAANYPQYLTSLGLFHSSAFADNDEKKQSRKKAIEFIKKNGASSFIKNTIPGLFNETYLPDNQVHINALLEAGKNFTAAALIQYYEAMIGRPDRTEVLRNLPKPVLFIIGEHDKAVPIESSLQQCYLPAQSHVHILEKSGHMGMFEETEKVNTILFNFLQDFKIA